MTDLIKKITEIIEQKFLEEEFRDCYIVEVKINKNLKLEIFVDSDSGMTINKCTSVSRYVGKFLEEADLISDKYTLEVSSPGLERPLIKRQFPKNLGKFINIKLKNKTVLEGILSFVDENGIIVEYKDKKESKNISIAFDEIEEAKIIFKFNIKQK
ncbi:MAG: ribosome maturation factor RimP [Saprospiraceae bacterium]|nr:ribosome maturation factor RimP [Saprospiraceae bacterium]